MSGYPAILLLFITIFLSALGFFTSFSVTAAVPAMQRDLGISLDQVQWILNGFVISQSIFILISGSLSDRFGRRNILLLGLGIFGIATLLCGFSHTATQLIVFRVLQGVGSALLIPQSLAIINTAYVSKIRGQVMGIWGGASGALSLAAPLIGGATVDYLGWRSVFFMLLPLILIALVLVVKFVPATTKSLSQSVDWAGTLVISVSLFILSYGAAMLRSASYNPVLAVGTLIAGLALLPIFYVVERKQAQPLIDFSIFKSKEVIAANVFTLLLYTIVVIIPFLLTLYLQQLMGHSATRASLEQLPLAVTITLVTFLSGGWADRFGAKRVLIVGASLVAVGCFWLSFLSTETGYWSIVFPGLILMGLGFGIFVPGLSKAALDVPEEFSGMASGVNNSVSGLAAIFALSVLLGVMLFGFRRNLEQELSRQLLNDDTAKTYLIENSTQLLNIEIPSSMTQTNKDAARNSIQRAFLESAKLQFLLLAGLATTGAISTYLIFGSKQRS